MYKSSHLCMSFPTGCGMVSLFIYSDKFEYVDGSTKTVNDEYGSSIPRNIDAADREYGVDILYLVSGKKSTTCISKSN